MASGVFGKITTAESSSDGLIEFHGAVVAGGDLFAAVQGWRAGKVARQTADADGLCAAGHALRSQARQTRSILQSGCPAALPMSSAEIASTISWTPA